MQEATIIPRDGEQSRESVLTEIMKRKVHLAGDRVMEDMQPLSKKQLKAERRGELF